MVDKFLFLKDLYRFGLQKPLLKEIGLLTNLNFVLLNNAQFSASKLQRSFVQKFANLLRIYFNFWED